MNHPSKQLLFNKSTFLSLKAELLKKQEEVKGKKQLPQHKVENYKPPISRATHSSEKNETFKEKLEKDVDTDEIEAQKRSKSALERKAELYNHLTDGSGTSQLSSRFLVNFKAKNEEEKRQEDIKDSDRDREDSDKLEYEDDDEDWVDFTDCLGRTRRCLKTDLDVYRRRDDEIRRALGQGETAEEPCDENQHEMSVAGEKEKPLLVQQTDAYLQSLRHKWEEKERELLERHKDIHYQDLLFDEARAHGVAYYGFSTEEGARSRQQAELQRARQETAAARAAAAERRAARESALAERVAAARARQRLRAGLPPLEPDENKDEFQLSSILDFLTEQKNEAAKKAKEEEDRRREEKEKERQKLREQYVREWDVGKEGVGDGKKFRELTQEEYEEQQRSKRIDEFSPLNGGANVGDNMFDDKGRFIGNSVPPPSIKTWADVRKNNSDSTDINLPSTSNTGLFFSSKESKKHSRVEVSDPEPIVDELEEREEPQSKRSRRNNAGVEIEPPSTYEYYGPEVKHARSGPRHDLRDSYEQGLKFLQDMEKKKKAPRKDDFVL